MLLPEPRQGVGCSAANTTDELRMNVSPLRKHTLPHIPILSFPELLLFIYDELLLLLYFCGYLQAAL